MTFAAAATVLAVGACSSGGGPELSIDDLRDTGDRCPVALAGTDLVADELGPVEVDVTEGSGDGDAAAGDSAIDQAGGVYVECRTGDADGTVAVVFASPRPNAMALLLPLVSQDLGLTTDQLEDVLTAYEDTDDGELVDLGAEGPAAAVRIEVDDAESAVLYLSTDGAAPDEVAATARELADDL